MQYINSEHDEDEISQDLIWLLGAVVLFDATCMRVDVVLYCVAAFGECGVVGPVPRVRGFIVDSNSS
jgi:hypothetical protein